MPCVAGSTSGQFFTLLRKRILRLLQDSELSWFGSQQLMLVSLVLCLLSCGGDSAGPLPPDPDLHVTQQLHISDREPAVQLLHQHQEVLHHHLMKCLFPNISVFVL